MTNRICSFGLFVTTLFFVSCGSSSDNKSSTPTIETTDQAVRDTVPPAPIDYSSFDYKLPQSNYSYKVKITGIETKVVKDAFTTKADDYSIPKKVDGYYLTIKFSLTNPYDREMMAPVPDYFYISSYNKKEWFSGSTTYHRDCQCDIDNSTKVTTDKGVELYNVSEGKCGYDDYCLRYKPNETKDFIINFTDPVFGEVRKLVFCGFDRKWKNPENTRDRDIASIIDIDKLEVTGDIRF
jgi:hypothetical protein